MKSSMNFCRHRLHSTFNLLKLCANDFFPELKEKEAAFERNQLLTALDVDDMNYKTNFMILEMARLHVMFFRK